MKEELNQLPRLAKDKEKENSKFLSRLKKKPPKNLDYVMQELHDEVFKDTDCLSCANCCKTTGPLFTEADIERISKFLKVKPSRFEEEYLRTDEDGDKVLKTLPCPFLASDNYCLIYEVRPKACREYPHTDRKKFHQITNITLKNTFICPAAFKVVEAMKQRLPSV